MNNIFGWSDIQTLGQEIWGSIHCSLLAGDLVFAYKGIGDINRLVITQTKDKFFMVGMITPGYTMLLPKVPKEYLTEQIVADLKTKKVETKIQEEFKNILKTL